MSITRFNLLEGCPLWQPYPIPVTTERNPPILDSRTPIPQLREIVVEHRLFRPCGQHNQTDNRPTPTLWRPAEHNAFKIFKQLRYFGDQLSTTCLMFYKIFKQHFGSRSRGKHPCAELFRCSALALRGEFRSPVRHGRHYNKTILDTTQPSRIRGRHLFCMGCLLPLGGLSRGCGIATFFRSRL